MARPRWAANEEPKWMSRHVWPYRADNRIRRPDWGSMRETFCLGRRAGGAADS
jgi:hypothetical protein